MYGLEAPLLAGRDLDAMIQDEVMESAMHSRTKWGHVDDHVPNYSTSDDYKNVLHKVEVFGFQQRFVSPFKKHRRTVAHAVCLAALNFWRKRMPLIRAMGKLGTTGQGG